MKADSAVVKLGREIDLYQQNRTYKRLGIYALIFGGAFFAISLLVSFYLLVFGKYSFGQRLVWMFFGSFIIAYLTWFAAVMVMAITNHLRASVRKEIYFKVFGLVIVTNIIIDLILWFGLANSNIDLVGKSIMVIVSGGGLVFMGFLGFLAYQAIRGAFKVLK